MYGNWTKQLPPRHTAADRRASGLPALFRGKLAAIGRQCYGTVLASTAVLQCSNTVVGEVGYCQERLESLGHLLQMVVGYWGETLTDLDRMIRAIAESRVL